MILWAFLNATIQLLAFCLIPFIVYLLRTGKYRGFLRYTGLHAAPYRAMGYAFIVAIVLACTIIPLILASPMLKSNMVGPDTVENSILQAQGPAARIIVILLISLVKTALAEEIFFRGFIAKLLIHWLGFKYGNLLQAFIFGLIHLLGFLTLTHAGPLFLTFAFLLPGAIAWLMGYLNEKTGKGSIFPGWLIHALVNTITYTVFTFFY
jgi:membrane protease YdiL (CAAX protease family)